jgi:hypothetical protein
VNGNNTDTICSSVSIVNVVVAGMGVGAPPPGTCAYGTGDPTAGKGTVSTGANGTYQINATGYNPTGCLLLPVPMAGGEIPNPAAGPKPAGGNWGPVTVNNLPTGQYFVVGEVVLSNGTVTVNILSPGAVVNVQ